MTVATDGHEPTVYSLAGTKAKETGFLLGHLINWAPLASWRSTDQLGALGVMAVHAVAEPAVALGVLPETQHNVYYRTLRMGRFPPVAAKIAAFDR